ncbi:hypothetical protein RHORCCE3_1691 [Rickettsia hoogstraalii str. RCCE3]|nr:hypothetical protein RHORCCE3_1691 [Rickettsia hoogstraalii str. RCCE3]
MLPLIEYGYSHDIHGLLTKDIILADFVDSLCGKQCGSLINKEELEISKFVEVVKLRVQNIDSKLVLYKKRLILF